MSYVGFVLGPAAVGLVAEISTLRIALGAVAAVAAALALAGRSVVSVVTRNASAAVAEGT